MTGPAEDTCLTCRHPDHRDDSCEVPVVSTRHEADAADPVPCGCDDPWTLADHRAAPPVMPDPWAQGTMPPPPF